VVRDREHVVPGPLVMADEHLGWKLPVGVRGVGVQTAPEPHAVGTERIPRLGHGGRAYSRNLETDM
jgi:hypothetical protein